MTTQQSDGLPVQLKEQGGTLAVFRTGIALSVYFGCAMLWFGVCTCLVGAAPLFVAVQGGDLIFCLRMGIGGILGLAGGLIALLRSRWIPRIQVFLFPQAMACVEGEEIEIVRWEDVNRLWRVDGDRSKPGRPPGEGVYQLILDRRDGRRFVFNESLSGFRSFCQLVKEQTLRYMLPPALEAFEGGAIIGFGAVSLSPEGIQCGQDMLPWDLFDRAEVSKGQLHLYSRECKQLYGRVELAQVPNFHVLLALTEHAHPRQA